MDRTRFYELIDAAREGVEDDAPSADADELRTVLDPLDDEELLGFVRVFRDELVRLNRWDVWAAGYTALRGMSDDPFHYFRCWLVGKGSAAVDTALTDPDGLADYLDDDLENEPLEYAALDLLDERGLPDPRLDDDAGVEDGEPEGERFDEDDLQQRFPRISARAAEPEDS